MTYRKTWFDYVLWAVYAGLCVMFLAYTGNHLYVFYVGASIAKLGTFVLFPVLLCLYPGIRLSGMAVRKRHNFSTHFRAMTEALVVSVSFVFGTMIRIKEGLLMAAVYDMGSALEAGDYYNMALIRAGEESAPLAHGMSDLFVRCLRVVFSFLGNSAAAAVLFQVFLQVLSMFFAYLAVRKAAGRLVSCTVLLFLAFSASLIRKVYIIDPECLLTALFLLGLYLTLSFVKSMLAGKEIYGGIPGMFLLGAALGLLCYLEGGCAVLFLFLAGVFTGKPGIGGNRAGKQKIRNLLIVMVGACVGFFGAVAEDAAASGVIFYRGITGWAKPYLHPEMGARIFSVIGTEYPFFAFLFLLASFVVFSFIRGGREQIFSLWFLPCILVTPVFVIDMSVSGFGGIALFFWCVMAGLGLKSAALDGEEALVREKIEEINAAAPAVPLPAEGILEETPEQKPRFIENPLPLPRKHVRREMGFDYSVSDSDMHYDVEVAEEDDFDK